MRLIFLLSILMSFNLQADPIEEFRYSFCNSDSLCFLIESKKVEKSSIKDVFYMNEANLQVFKDRKRLAESNLTKVYLNHQKKLLQVIGGKVINLNSSDFNL